MMHVAQRSLFGKAHVLKPKKTQGNRGEQTFAFQVRAYSLPPAIPQFPFALALGRKFTADFAFPTQRLLVEIKGGIWRKGGGAHSHPVDLMRDIEREQYAALLGYILLPFTPQQVESGFAIEWTTRVLHRLGWNPQT